MLFIAEHHIVSIRYIMKNNEGEILENTLDGDPVSYLQGSPGIQPLLQAQLTGLKKGDRKTVYLNAVTGLTDKDFVFEVIIDDVREALKEELLLGYPVQVNVVKCEPDCDCYD
ncbi:MAG: hypothetical protein ABIQ31_18055 [Ferruginibacter sp.]